MKDNSLLKYAEQLAIEIETLCKSLERKDNSNAIFQTRKYSSSVFANITEAQYSQSLPDMLPKFKIARKECVETESWLKLLYSNNTKQNWMLGIEWPLYESEASKRNITLNLTSNQSNAARDAFTDFMWFQLQKEK